MSRIISFFLLSIVVVVSGSCSSTNLAVVEPEENCRLNLRATQPELNECYRQIAQVSQDELDDLLASIEAIYPETIWKPLAENQREWEHLREKDCIWATSFWEGGSIAPMQYRGCIHATNLRRIAFIKSSVCIPGLRWTGELEACDSLEELSSQR
jgi:uncharacterized protein YecT (DUF1311 family)